MVGLADLAIAGIPAGMLVVALVEAIKRLAKIEGDAAIAVAVVVGVLVMVGARLAIVSPAFGEWWQVIVIGLLLGLSACGLFDLGQALKARVQ